MTYEEWLAAVPEEIRRDSLWRMDVYRRALFLGDLAWHDAERIAQVPHGRSLADQLLRAAGSISANISEGFSRPTNRDRTRFYSYALGSAREARDWYYKARHLLGDEVASHRLSALSHVIQQLINLQKQQGRRIEEETSPYHDDSTEP